MSPVNAAGLVSAGSGAAFAVAVWWTSNTVGHLVIHRPFFRGRAANQLLALGVSAAIGIPQTLWRDRHLAHHAGVEPRLRVSGDLLIQVAFVLALWAVMLDRAPSFFATVYVPGYVGGLVLCALHGHYEHAGGTISHYGRLYNALTFNDGYHVEHHAHPGVPWSRLPERREAGARTSAWPAPLRWIESAGGLRDSLEGVVDSLLSALERLVLRSRSLQRFVLRVHERALRDLIAMLPPLRHVVIVGGGLFPRTALILRSLAPNAQITIIDASRENLALAKSRVADIAFVHARYATPNTKPRSTDPDVAGALASLPGDGPAEKSNAPDVVVSDVSGSDLLIIPLCFDGDREAVYEHPPARAVIVHDWLWRQSGASRVVSLALLKRVNLVTRA